MRKGVAELVCDQSKAGTTTIYHVAFKTFETVKRTGEGLVVEHDVE